MPNCSRLPDHALLGLLATLLAQDRVTTSDLLACLAEVDERRLYLPAAYPSMYQYCVKHLHMSEDAACRRIGAARTARRFPQIFPALADGRLNLNTVLLLAPYLTSENADSLLREAVRRTKPEIELLLAARFPKPDLATSLVAIPPAPVALDLAPACAGLSRAGEVPAQVVANTVSVSAPARIDMITPRPGPGPEEAPAPRAKLAPLSPGRFSMQFTMEQQMHDDLRYAQALLGHAEPSGDPVKVLGRALKALIRELERTKFAVASRSAPGGRRRAAHGRTIPAPVRRAVVEGDQGQCSFTSPDGRRCGSRTRLEYDHITPICRGGLSTVENLRLRCRAHNQHEADRTLGKRLMDEKRSAARSRASAKREATRPREVAAKPNGTTAIVSRTQEAPRASMAPPVATEDVTPWLRALGFRAEEARRAAARCVDMPDSSLEVRVRHALKHLAPHGARRTMPIASSPA